MAKKYTHRNVDSWRTKVSTQWAEYNNFISQIYFSHSIIMYIIEWLYRIIYCTIVEGGSISPK